jgi:hypothetical protein
MSSIKDDFELPLMFAIDQDADGMFHVVTTKEGYLILQEFLDTYAAVCSQEDLHNPYVQ